MIQSIRRASKRVCSPNTKIGLALLKKLNLEEGKDLNGFTLIELIVVVMIIGILSSIAVPSFLGSADKAKQKEASIAMGSFLKAAQAYYTEYSSVPVNAGGLANYVTVTQCTTSAGAAQCKNRTPTAASSSSYQWYSPSGNYRYLMQRNSSVFRMLAYPNGGSFAATGYGVRSCFNPATGGSKLFENSGDNKGTRNMGWPSC